MAWRKEREANLSTESTQAETHAWISRSDENARRAQGIEAAASKGAEAVNGLIKDSREGGRPRFRRMPTRAFSPHERLRQHEEFQTLFRRGQKVESHSFLLLWRRGGGVKRVGFALSRQVRGAVRRNRARRRVREAYRLNRDLLQEGTQVVFVVRSGALAVEFSDLLKEVQRGLRAAGGSRNEAA